MGEYVKLYVIVALLTYAVLRLIIKDIYTRLLITYCLVILLYTVVLRTPTSTGYKIIPFWSYYCIWIDWFRKELLIENLLNICMMIPFGFLSFGCGKITNVKRTVVIAFLFEIAIEVLQLVFHRGLAEWDDVIHGCIGTIIGWGIAMLLLKIRNHNWRKDIF